LPRGERVPGRRLAGTLQRGFVAQGPQGGRKGGPREDAGPGRVGVRRGVAAAEGDRPAWVRAGRFGRGLTDRDVVESRRGSMDRESEAASAMVPGYVDLVSEAKRRIDLGIEQGPFTESWESLKG